MTYRKEIEVMSDIKTRFSVVLKQDEAIILNQMLQDWEELGFPMSKAQLVRKILNSSKAFKDYRGVSND